MSFISILCNCVAVVPTSLEHLYHGFCAPMFANTFFDFPSSSVLARHVLLICVIRWHYRTDMSKTSLVKNYCTGASPKEKHSGEKECQLGLTERWDGEEHDSCHK